MITSLIGRKVIQGWNGETRGTIVAVFSDRGEFQVVVEAAVSGALDGRTALSVEMYTAVILAPEEVSDANPK